MVLLLLGIILLLPFTIYSIISKPKTLPSPEFEKIEKEINEWLRSRAHQALEEASLTLDRISYIDRKESLRIADVIQDSIFSRPQVAIRAISDAIIYEGSNTSPESYLTEENNSTVISGFAGKVQHVIPGLKV